MNFFNVSPSHRAQSFRNRLLQCESFPQGTALHKLLQHGSLPTGCSPSGTGCSSSDHRVTSPDSKSAPAWAPLSTGPQVLPGACSSEGFPRDHSLLQASTCSSVGSSTGCRWISAPPWTSMGCRGRSCLTMVFTMGCRGTSGLVPGAGPPPPSSRTLASAELFHKF